MGMIHMSIYFPDRLSELNVSDPEHTELTIESIVGTALLEVCDTVHVEKVIVYHSPERKNGDGEWVHLL